MTRGSKPNVSRSACGSDLPQLRCAVDFVQCFAPAVGAVEQYVVAHLLEAGPPLCEPDGDLVAAAYRQAMHDLLGCVEQRHGSIELFFEAAGTGEAPLGAGGGMTFGVVDGMVLEPLHGRLGEHLEAQRVDCARCHLEDLRLGHRPPCCDRDDRGCDHVDRDHVDDALGVAREGVEFAFREGHEQWLGHAESADPAW